MKVKVLKYEKTLSMCLYVFVFSEIEMVYEFTSQRENLRWELATKNSFYYTKHFIYLFLLEVSKVNFVV